MVKKYGDMATNRRTNKQTDGMKSHKNPVPVSSCRGQYC